MQSKSTCWSLLPICEPFPKKSEKYQPHGIQGLNRRFEKGVKRTVSFILSFFCWWSKSPSTLQVHRRWACRRCIRRAWSWRYISIPWIFPLWSDLSWRGLSIVCSTCCRFSSQVCPLFWLCNFLVWQAHGRFSSRLPLCTRNILPLGSLTRGIIFRSVGILCIVNSGRASW